MSAAAQAQRARFQTALQNARTEASHATAITQKCMDENRELTADEAERVIGHLQAIDRYLEEAHSAR